MFLIYIRMFPAYIYERQCILEYFLRILEYFQCILENYLYTQKHFKCVFKAYIYTIQCIFEFP